LTFFRRFYEIRTGFDRPFWVANVSELFERLSYYAAFSSLPRYLHESLNFGVERASSLAGLFGGLVWFLAAFGGALADRMGFRRALSLAYLILATSYFLLGSINSPWLAPVRDAMPLVVLVTLILMLPALGIALVKPCVVGTTARASKGKRALHWLLDLLHPGEHWRGRGAFSGRDGCTSISAWRRSSTWRH
jgi:POT family proton-dependent oligopeptide transporter